MKAGDQFSVFNETEEWLVEAKTVDRKKVIAKTIEVVKRNTEPKQKVILYQGIPKKADLFEWVVQKATEIGVTEIVPLITKRTEKHHLKIERLKTIAMEATEQSRRLKIPIVHEPVKFEKIIPNVEGAYLAYENEKGKTLSHYLSDIKKEKVIHLFIGPEGGFEPQEINLAASKKARLFSLGPRILRTETAALSALSIILLGN